MDNTDNTKNRRSLMRASIALIMHRHGMSVEEIDAIMNESYALSKACREQGESVWDLFTSETGLYVI